MVILQSVSLDRLSPVELASEMAGAIAALADIDARYERDREGILRWVGPEASKQRLLERLAASRMRDREELVSWLADASRDRAVPTQEKSPATSLPLAP